MIRNIRILLYELTVHDTDEEVNEAIDESMIGCLRISCLRTITPPYRLQPPISPDS